MPDRGFVLEFPGLGGGSCMGGLGALIFVADAKVKPTACVAVCPCVDVPACFSTHERFRRMFFCAVADYEDEIDASLLTLSPLHRMSDIPQIPYFLINDCSDELFPEEQMDRYVEKMRALGHQVDYDRLIGCRHGEITGEAWEHIITFLCKHLGL